MKVAEVMCREITIVSLNTPFRDLWRVIFKKHVNAIPVADETKKLVGIITRDDILKSLYPNYAEFIAEFSASQDFEEMEEKIHELLPLKAGDIMCKKVIHTRTETPIMRALSRMIVRSVKQLPVLDEMDRVVGMITKGDIFYALFKRHLIGGERMHRLVHPKAPQPKKSAKKSLKKKPASRK